MRFKQLATLLVVAVAAMSLVGCGGGSGAPTTPEVEVTTPTVSIIRIDPPAGSTLKSGQTLTVDLEFSLPRADYPLEVTTIFWTVIPGSSGYHEFGEGRGCEDQNNREGAYKDYAPTQAFHCTFYLDPIIWGWWQDAGVKSITLDFTAVNKQHPYHLGDALLHQEFPGTYQVP